MADYDAKQFEPTLVPHFPVLAFKPSDCPHRCGMCSGRGTLRFGLEGPPPPCPACKTTGMAGYRRGSSLCCMICHRSGKDHMPIFRNVPEPAIPKPPDPKEPDPFIKAWSEIIWNRFTAYGRSSEAAPSVPDPKLPKETRKERRRRLFGDIVSTLATGPPPAA